VHVPTRQRLLQRRNDHSLDLLPPSVHSRPGHSSSVRLSIRSRTKDDHNFTRVPEYCLTANY
jgi:hypothetical protein